MKRFFDLSDDLNFWILLGFLFLIPFTIAGCYVLFSLLCIPFIVSLARRRALAKIPHLFWFFAAYAAVTLLATVFSVDPLNSLLDNKELLTFLFFPICVLILHTRQRLRLSLAVVLVSACLSAAVGIGQALLQGVSEEHRIKGLTSHWMTYSGLLMQVFVFFSIYWLLIVLRRNGKLRPVLLLTLAALLFLFTSIVLSLTRGVWLGIGAAAFLFLFFFKPRWMAVAVPAAALLLALVMLLLPAVRMRVISIFDLHHYSNRDRLHMFYSGWRLFQDHPLTGIGANNVKSMAARDEYRHPQADKEKLPEHMHNDFLQALVERGLLGLSSFLAIWIFFFAAVLRRLRRMTASFKAVAVAALFTVVAFLVEGLFEYNFGDAEVRFLLLFFLALPFLFQRESDDDHNQTSRRNLFDVF